MAKPASKPKDDSQQELKELLDSPPPDPRAAGISSVSTPVNDATPDEDTIVDAIADENARNALDEIDQEAHTPEEPTIIIGEKKPHWYSFLKRPKFWVVFIGLLLAVLSLAWLITPSRIWVLNTLGLRTEIDFATVVSTPQGPPPILKNALVTINGQEYHTNDDGRLKLSVPYGNTRIAISKPGYETITKEQMLDFDPFFYLAGGKQADEQVRKQTFIMKSVGIEVRFTAKDWLTGQPVTVGHFGVGDVVTTPGAQGEVVLTIPATDAKTVQLNAKFGGSGYADTTVDVALSATALELTFVPAGKHYFISKRTGQFVVYSSNIDGTAVAEVVPAVSAETGDIAFTVSPNGKYGILASTREATRDSFGSVQQKAYVVDLATKKLTPVDTALRFSFVDWSGDSVVYTAEVRNASGAIVERLVSVSAATGTMTNLANDPDFKVVRVRLGSALYITEGNELRTVKVAGGAEKSLGIGIKKFTQPEPDKFAYQIADSSWRQYDVNADQVSTVATPAAQSRAFLAGASGDSQTLLAVETLDGKPALIAKAVGSGQETKLYTGTGLTGPVRWIGTVAIYRVGAADYAIGAGGGITKKITDVTTSLNVSDEYFAFN